MAEDTKIRGRKQAKGSKNVRRKLTELVRSKRQSGRQDNAEDKTRGVIKAFTRSIFIILAPVIMPAIIVMMGIVAILVAFAGKSGIDNDDFTKSIFDASLYYDSVIDSKLIEAGYDFTVGNTVFVRGNIDEVYECLYVVYAVNYVMYGEGINLNDKVREQFVELNTISVQKYQITNFEDGRNELTDADGNVITLPEAEEDNEKSDDESSSKPEEKDSSEEEIEEETSHIDNYWVVNLSSIPAESIIDNYSLDTDQREKLDFLLSEGKEDMINKIDVELGLIDDSRRTNMLLIAHDEIGQGAKKYIEDYGFEYEEGLEPGFTLIAYLAKSLYQCFIPDGESETPGSACDYSFPYTSNLQYSINWFKKTGQWREADSGYEPVPGDLVYLADKEGKCVGVGLYTLNENEEHILMTIIEGKVAMLEMTTDIKVYGMASIDYNILE